MTEEEAKTKWCPFVRTPGAVEFSYNDATYRSQPVSVNRHPHNSSEPSICCIGSACAAWRWGGYFGGQTTVHVAMQMDEKTGAMETVSESPPKQGYCGLAGRP